MPQTPESPDQSVEAAMLSLKKIALDAEYQVYINESGPLTLDQLPSDSNMSDYVLDKIFDANKHVGWPNYIDDNPVSKPRQFHTDVEFLHALRPHGEDGPEHVVSSFFYSVLLVDPFDTPRVTTAKERLHANMYNGLPFVLRANAAFPELFDSLRTTLTDITIEYDDAEEDDLIYEELLKEKNKPVLTGMRMAYGLMTRLVKQDDIVRHRRIIQSQGVVFHQNKITDSGVDPESLVLYGNMF